MATLPAVVVMVGSVLAATSWFGEGAGGSLGALALAVPLGAAVFLGCARLMRVNEVSVPLTMVFGGLVPRR